MLPSSSSLGPSRLLLEFPDDTGFILVFQPLPVLPGSTLNFKHIGAVGWRGQQPEIRPEKQSGQCPGFFLETFRRRVSTESAGQDEEPGPGLSSGAGTWRGGVVPAGSSFLYLLLMRLSSSSLGLRQQLPGFGIGPSEEGVFLFCSSAASGELVMTHSNVGDQCLSPGPLSSSTVKLGPAPSLRRHQMKWKGTRFPA